jgi:hypothetical protein
MSQQDPYRRPGEEPARGGQQDRLPPDEGTLIIHASDVVGEPGPPVEAASGAVAGTCPNPACRQPVGPDVRFCQACGTDLEGERPRPWLIIVGVVWILIAIGAYALLYSNAFVIGRP